MKILEIQKIFTDKFQESVTQSVVHFFFMMDDSHIKQLGMNQPSVCLNIRPAVLLKFSGQTLKGGNLPKHIFRDLNTDFSQIKIRLKTEKKI